MHIPSRCRDWAQYVQRQTCVHVRKYLEETRSSLWFVPSVIVIASIGAALLLVDAEWSWFAKALKNHAPRFYATSPNDARQLIGAIATSVLTVTGVTFSVTVVTLSLVASQYTPRVVRTFMRSRKTQITLGVLMGVYAYALIVLRTVSGGASMEVPNLAINVAGLYAFVGLLNFIIFVDHIAYFIQPATIAAGIYAETLQSIRTTFSEEKLDEEDGHEIEKLISESTWHPLSAPKAGYVQQIELDVVKNHGARTGNAVRLAVRIGEFVIVGEHLLYVANAGPNEAESRRLIAAVSIGTHRTIEQDPSFGVRQLVDMALKGLSPSIHDPMTAMMCIDHLAALLSTLATRQAKKAHRNGAEHEILVVVFRSEFEQILGNAIEAICLAAKEHPQVLERLARMLAKIAHDLPAGTRRQWVGAQLSTVADQVNRLGPVPGRAQLITVVAHLREELDK